MTRSHRVALALALAGAIAVAGPASARVERSAAAWSITGDAEAEADEELSGAACAANGLCLLVSDEDRRSWLFTLDRADPARPALRIRSKLDLQPAQAGKEADAEAAASDGAYLYAIGSHARGRKKARFEPSRFSVYRISPEDGRMVASGALLAQLATIAAIKPHLCTASDEASCEALQVGGANIEGMAVRDGALFVGMRAPLDASGRALVVRTSLASVFDAAAAAPVAYALPLGTDAAGPARHSGHRDGLRRVPDPRRTVPPRGERRSGIGHAVPVGRPRRRGARDARCDRRSATQGETRGPARAGRRPVRVGCARDA